MRSEVQNKFHWVKIKALAELSPSGGQSSPAFSRYWRQAARASLWPLPPVQIRQGCELSFACILFIRMLDDISLGIIISETLPFQTSFSHTCRAPLATPGSVFTGPRSKDADISAGPLLCLPYLASKTSHGVLMSEKVTFLPPLPSKNITSHPQQLGLPPPPPICHPSSPDVSSSNSPLACSHHHLTLCHHITHLEPSVLSASTLSSPQLILHQCPQRFKTPNLVHVSPLLKTLDWLPDTLRGKTQRCGRLYMMGLLIVPSASHSASLSYLLNFTFTVAICQFLNRPSFLVPRALCTCSSYSLKCPCPCLCLLAFGLQLKHCFLKEAGPTPSSSLSPRLDTIPLSNALQCKLCFCMMVC